MKNIIRIAIVLLFTIPLAASAQATSSPVISGASDITAEATSSAGAFISFSITATDATGTSITASCTPPSASLFALGTTTVSCSATDSLGNTASTSFHVIVRDTIPPAITPPATQTFATSTFPATPTLTPATATDAVDPSPQITLSTTTFAVGTTTVTWTATDASGNSATTTSFVVITDDSATSAASSSPDTITLSLRDGTTLVGPATLDLPAASSSAVAIAPTGATTTYAVPARSVLALLSSYAASSSAFSISDLQYYSSYSAFYVHCITIPAATSSPLCASWQYSLNGTNPSVGMDAQTLSPGDSVIVYFGSPRETVLSTTTVPVGTSFTATAESYDPSTDTFSPTTGVTLGVIAIPDPSQSWVYTEVATSTADANGQAIFTLNATGTYQVGIQDDYYSPSASITVTATTTSTSQTSSGGGGGGVLHGTFNMPSALAFLASEQNKDGSFGAGDASVITDWTAIALASESQSSAETKLRAYLLTAAPAMSSVTDYERHAMALEALGINPYSGTGVNYIAPIVAAFDGTQIGDPSLDNDDIFALFALLSAGYTAADDMPQKIATFILSKQLPDGSWDESPDMTAAALQVLPNFFVGSNISPATLGQALGGGELYLIKTQHNDGGWNGDKPNTLTAPSNVDSTSWVQVFINAVNLDDPSNTRDWTNGGGYLPTDAIASAQEADGGVHPLTDATDTRIWSTAYAVVAASGKDWDSLLGSFTRPTTVSNGGGRDVGGNGEVFAAAPVASSSAATTTPAGATSTPPMLASSTLATMPSTGRRPVTHAVTRFAPSPAQAVTPAEKKPVPPLKLTTRLIAPLASSTLAQAAAAGSAGGGFFYDLWHALTSFFSWMF